MALAREMTNQCFEHQRSKVSNKPNFLLGGELPVSGVAAPHLVVPYNRAYLQLLQAAFRRDTTAH
jgi:hypothetical protein